MTYACDQMVGFPYTKYMCAFNEIDMGAAVLLTSVGKAKEMGISADKVTTLRLEITMDPTTPDLGDMLLTEYLHTHNMLWVKGDC